MLFRPLITLFEFIWPRRCLACCEPSGAEIFCAPCADSTIDSNGSCCPGCGQIQCYEHGSRRQTHCGGCMQSPPPWVRVRSAFAYGGAIQTAICRWKNVPEAGMGRDLSRLMCAQDVIDTWEGLPPDTLVIPIPSERRKFRTRGFNPAGILAVALARSLRLRIMSRTLTVKRPMIESRSLGSSSRKRRVRGAFGVMGTTLNDRVILLVDDVMTTGATAREAARTCVKAGAREVHLAVLAVVPRDG